MKPVIIGAGPAGLSAAYELSRNGVTSVIVEADPSRVGGLSQTATYREFRFDIGGHRFFSKNDEIEAIWTEILGADMIDVARSSRIFYRGRFFDYPLRPWNALVNLGPFEALRCLFSYAWARLFPRRPVVSFEDWVVNQFGERLFNIFFKTYTEKVWGIPTHEISADWAAQRIKGLSLMQAVMNALFGGRKDGRVITTLIDTFRYPRRGPGMMWERLAERLAAEGSDLRLGSPVVAVERDTDGVVAVRCNSAEGETRLEATHVVSSMPLRELVLAMTPAAPYAVQRAAADLKYRDFLTVVLIVEQTDLFPDNWIYIHDAHLQVGRVQNYGNWSPDMVPTAGHSCLGLEYFCFENDEMWNADDETLIALGQRELTRMGLVDGSRVRDGCVVRMPKAYPVYDETYQANVDIVRAWLEENVPNLQVMGRNGMHRYNNMDHAMMTGLLAARNLLGGDWDLWKVNADAQYLEEDSGGPQGGRAVPRRTRPAG